MNDNYCYQTSKKIRQVFDYKPRSVQYIGSFAPYGYIKNPKDKHQPIVDAAEIVKRVYSMLLQGSSKRAIALYLNGHGIPNPIYTGDLVQGHRRVKSYKVHQIEAVTEEEWVRVPDTHEAIITHETFDKMQALLVAFAKYQSIETLTHEILTDLVEHIKVYENGNISVHFKFADEFRKIAAYIKSTPLTPPRQKPL